MATMLIVFKADLRRAEEVLARSDLGLLRPTIERARDTARMQVEQMEAGLRCDRCGNHLDLGCDPLCVARLSATELKVKLSAACTVNDHKACLGPLFNGRPFCDCECHLAS
jgi:hypothetical protein